MILLKRFGERHGGSAVFSALPKARFSVLKQYARAYALAIYKAKTLADMRRALPSVHALLDSEISHHVTYCGQWGLTESDLKTNQKISAPSLTRYVLDAGMTGDLVDLYAALAPCSIGYAVIGKALLESSDTVLEGNPYASWLQLYGVKKFQSGVATGAEYFNQLLAEVISTASAVRTSYIYSRPQRVWKWLSGSKV
ncbi:hypothetical protein OH492_09940 [Vibrio chagasii]|nr:hypothetical protein [Vibrio chagasii]